MRGPGKGHPENRLANQTVELEVVVTTDALTQRLSELADRILADSRWESQRDDLGISVLGMLLYGYALAVGRSVMFLDMEDIDAAVLRCLTERAGIAAKWGSGLVEEGCDR